MPNTPIPIALDEELIGINDPKLKEQMLDVINPQYIILKPALAGGLSGSAEWIDKAEKRNIGWWITSALESNVGLNAIAQWTAMLQSSIPQGLGTGQLYKNNIISPLVQKGSTIQYDPSLSWDLSSLIWGIVLNDRCYPDVDEISVTEDNIDVVSFLTEWFDDREYVVGHTSGSTERLRKFIY